MGKIVHLFLVFRSETGEFFDLNDFINSWFFFLFFFSVPRFTHQPRSLPQKCCESSKFRPSDGAARLFSFPKKRWAISRHWFHEIFWHSQNYEFSCVFFWYIFINCKYYKKTNSTYWGCHRKCLQLYFYFLFSYYHES